METRRPKSSSHKRSNIKPRKNKHHTHRRTKSQNTPPNHHHHHKKNGSASNTTTNSGGIQKNNNNSNSSHFKPGKNNNQKHHKKFPKKNFKKMDVERVPIVTKKIDYAVIARLLGLDQLNPGDKLSLANVRLDSASLDTGSIPQLEGLLDLFKKHKIAEPESLMNSVATVTSTGDGKVQFQPSILGDFLNSCVQQNNIIQNNNNNPLVTNMTTTAASTPQSISITLPTSGSLPAIPQYTDSLPLHTTSSLPTISIPSISSSGLPPLATSDLTNASPLNTREEIFRDSVNQFQQNWYGSFSRNISHKVSQNGKMVLLSNRRLTRRKK